MGTLAASIAETVAGMQRILHRDDYSSDSDEPYLRPSNHFNKLKRKSHFAARDPGGRVNGAQRSRKSVKLGGYTRDILRRNPKRYDEDGDELATEDEDEAADERAAAENPYSDIHLETLLAPLTAAEDLPNHPSLAAIYESRTLSDMTQHACEVLERERKTLAHSKRLLTRLRGDDSWIPAGRLDTNYDQDIFDTSRLYKLITSKGSSRETQLQPTETSQRVIKAHSLAASSAPSDNPSPRTSQGHDREDADLSIKPEVTESLGNTSDPHKVLRDIPSTTLSSVGQDIPTNGDHEPSSPKVAAENNILPSVEKTLVVDDATGETADDVMNDVEEGSVSPPRRITRAQAQADKVTASSRSESPPNWESPKIHPLFLLPADVKPIADMGLPPQEAAETRHLLAMYVQKQEEVCRGAQRLYEGLLRADRQRKEVFGWCKAEAHVGEMSDGEDWYDKEEWGLEEDLRKGHAEEEEDTVVQGKKTRGRRA